MDEIFIFWLVFGVTLVGSLVVIILLSLLFFYLEGQKTKLVKFLSGRLK